MTREKAVMVAAWAWFLIGTGFCQFYLRDRWPREAWVLVHMVVFGIFLFAYARIGNMPDEWKQAPVFGKRKS